MNERFASMIGGAALIAAGLSRRSLGGMFAAAFGSGLIYRGWTGHCGCYDALGVNTAAGEPLDGGVRARQGTREAWSVHIHRDARDLYSFWRNFENLPKVMRHLESVTAHGQTSHWVARAPLGQTLEWDAEIITDRPNELIAWRSLPGSQVATAGSVQFRKPPFGDGTEVSVNLKYDPPGGKLVAEMADLVGQGLSDQLEEDLRTFKQYMEAGEIATSSTRSQPERTEHLLAPTTFEGNRGTT
jgi:uncharacterized membrane protein